MGDEDLRRLQNVLLVNPRAGDAITGCPALRKIRFADPGRQKGTRSGVRVIYVYTPEASRIDFITVYGKDEADNLTPDQVQVLCGLARLLRKEATQRSGRRRRGDV